jgi:1-deoxy-D-xylulose-5-phosphate reductoisomerase
VSCSQLDAPRRISVLGATGSIGKSALSVIDHAAPGLYKVDVLTAHRNADTLAAAAIKSGARLAVIADETAFKDLKATLSGSGIEAAAGAQSLKDAVAQGSDCVIAAIVGAAGLAPTLAAAESGADIILTNKEALICAGDLLAQAVQRGGGRLLPADSEHNAIFQVFDYECVDRICKIVLTASGGPFRTWSRAQMAAASVTDALKHPTWSMGAKVSIDSATMFNKGLEVIEAARLFPVTPDQIDILVHPQSLVHGLVQYADGSLLAQLGPADMRTPLACALAWPDRAAAPVQPLDLAAIGQLDFELPDEDRFPSLRLCRTALDRGQVATAALNAANEVAVDAFLREKCGFLEIADIVAQVLENDLWNRVAGDTLEAMSAVDDEARCLARRFVGI